MKGFKETLFRNPGVGRSQLTRSKWARPAFIFVLAAAMASFGLLTERSVLADFTGGPSVRVSPNVRFEIRYIADFSGDGSVELFDNPNGTGTPIAVKVTASQANDQTLVFDVNNTVRADTQYYFRVTHHDPNSGVPDEVTQPPLPPVFTGAQTIPHVAVGTGTDTVALSWEANVIGPGRVTYGTSSPDELGPADDQSNTRHHFFQLTGLTPNTTYQYRVSNRHAIDGGTLAETTGSFTTLPSGPGVSGFTGGPSVRVSPNSKIEIRWIADFVGDGTVEVFDNANGGAPIDSANSTGNNEHRVEFTVGGVIQANKTYFFKVTHRDPTGARPDLTNDPAPYPPFFTGAQAIGDLRVLVGSNCTFIDWNANVIGFGRVTYGTSSPDEPGPAHDNYNTTYHGLRLANLAPNTTFQYRVATRHAIDGGTLAETIGSFTTLPSGAETGCSGFRGGPSVRVSPAVDATGRNFFRIEIRWIADFVGDGRVDVFDHPNGGTPIDVKTTPSSSTEHRVEFSTGGVLREGAIYYFKVTHSDPTGARADLTNDPAPYPPFFTGAQAVGNVAVTPGTDSARISWDANVIGLGRVTYGTSWPDELGPVDDYHHSLAHGVQLTGLTPNTTYHFRLANRHAIDGGTLAEATGSFTTLSPPDTTPPHITSSVGGTLGNTGWYVSDVTVLWTVTESESSVASQTGCATQTVSSDTGGVTFTCSATSEGGTSSQSVTVKRDATAPVLNPTVTPNPVALNGAATAAPNATDALSGIASQSCQTVNTTIAGNHSVACTATDNAGNAANANANYEVLSGYNFVGFFQPIDNLPTLNLATAGSAIPVKFSLTGYQGLAIFAAGYPASSPIQCQASNPGAVIEETVNAGSSSLNYNTSNDQYSYIWKTDKAWKGTCRMLVLKLNDNSQHIAKFRFR